MSCIHKDNTYCCAVLLQPPPGDLTGPYPALAYLKSYAALHGHTVRVRDLGIEALHFLTQKDKIAGYLERAASMRRELESKASLDSDELRHYRLLVVAAWIATKPDMIPTALRSFSDSSQFYNYRHYSRSCHVLNAFYGLLSAVHHPTAVTPSEYPTAQALNSMKNVLAHRRTDLNPYMEYYEEILFPALAGQAPTAIGLSMEFAGQSVQALVLGHLLKELFPEIHITMGGAYLSQWVMLMGERQLSELFSCTDSVICGEGESAFVQLLDGIEAGLSPSSVPNLIYRDLRTGEFHHPASLEYPDINSLPPPDFSDLDLKSYLIPKTVIPYAISRGCYWGKCVFCQNRYGENRMRKYQTVPVEKSIAEMSYLAEKYGTNHFNFSNDVLDPSYLQRLSEALIASKKKFLWNTDLRAEKAFSRDLCGRMARAGLNSVAIGLESGCQRTLDAMNKGKDVQTVRQVMKDLYDAGIATQAMGFFGFPEETEEEAERTVAFLEDNVAAISYYVIGLLMVVPGSRMHEEPQKYRVSSISYEGNELMAPPPVWRAEGRIPAAAVNRLYHRLSHLEETFAINEYPYVGALSTNHSFLYFETGPDVLKRLKREESDRHLKLLRIMATKDKSERGKKLKSLLPRFALPCLIYHTHFLIDQIENGDKTTRSRPRPFSPNGWDYLVGPSDMVIPIREVERGFLEAIDGKKNLKSVLAKYEDADVERLVSILLGLVSRGLIVI